MTLEELIAAFRQESGDKVRDIDGRTDDLLWSDEMLARWFTEAQEEAALRKRLLPDSTSVRVVPDQSAYPFTAFFEITRADLYRVTDLTTNPVTVERRGCELDIVSRERMDEIDPDWRVERREPGHLVQEDTRILLPAIIARDYVLKLEGLRLPLKPFTEDNLGAKPEIAPVHHRFLVHWSLFRAYGIQDADTFDAQRSARELGLFEAYFGKRPDADLRRDLRQDRPQVNKCW